MTSSSIATFLLASALLIAAPAFAQEAPGAPLGEAQAPMAAPPPGASEPGAANGSPQVPGTEAPDVLGHEAADSAAPERSEMAKPPVPDAMTSEDEEAE